MTAVEPWPREALISALQARFPLWQDEALLVTPLAGGITNQNFKVSAAGQHFVLRVCSPAVSLLGIDRHVELQCSQAAATAGVTPEVIGSFADLPGGKQALITRYVAGRPLAAEDLRAPQRLPAVVKLIRRYHGLHQFAGRFDVFRTVADGLAFCRQRSVPLPSWIDELNHRLYEITLAVRRRQLPQAACHNDLLSGNFLQQADGRLWLVDWEYAGWGDLFFDLGNLAVNNEFGDAEDELLLSLYCGERTAADLAHLKLMKLVSDVREGVWGLIQTQLSTLEFDYLAYGLRHLERFRQNSSHPSVAEWLALL